MCQDDGWCNQPDDLSQSGAVLILAERKITNGSDRQHLCRRVVLSANQARGPQQSGSRSPWAVDGSGRCCMGPSAAARAHERQRSGCHTSALASEHPVVCVRCKSTNDHSVKMDGAQTTGDKRTNIEPKVLKQAMRTEAAHLRHIDARLI